MISCARVVRSCLLMLAVAAGMTAMEHRPARAAEAAGGFYLLGLKTSMAGYVPPPGGYVQPITYYYHGETSNIIPFAGRLAAGIDASAVLEATNAFWIAPQKVLGGNVGVGVIVPYGRKMVDAQVQLTVQGLPLSGTLHDVETAWGDPVPSVFIGWHSGNWHWNLGALVNVPVGEWQRGRLANIGFNRWGVDVTGAVTWLDPKTGFEISGALGMTFNGENPATDYKTGTELHIEWAVMQHLGKQLSMGVAGYHYQQVTGDSGPGALLGPFEGRATGLGPIISYTFMAGKTPITTTVSWFAEFDVVNRLEGNAAILNVVIPLGGPKK